MDAPGSGGVERSARVVDRRNHEVDGIRGWAALSVLFFHVFWEMLGGQIPSLRNPVTNLLFNGYFSVLVFFVLSGDALATGCLNSVASMERVVVKRFFRLSIPIFLSSSIVYLVMVSNLDFHGSVVAMVKREDWLGVFLRFDPTLPRLVKFAFYRVYAEHVADKSFNPFLWTMSIELVGSLLVFAFCMVLPKLRFPVRILLGVSVWLLYCYSYYTLFFVGICFALWRKQGFFERLAETAWGRVGAPLGLLLLIPGVIYAKEYLYIQLMSSVGFVFCVYSSRMLRAFFSNRISRFLGRISFPLYLVHFSVIISLYCWLLATPTPAFAGSRDQWWMIAGGATIFVSVAAAVGFMKVENKCLAWLDKGARWIMHREPRREG